MTPRQDLNGTVSIKIGEKFFPQPLPHIRIARGKGSRSN
jgi:hypothetical protein